MIKQATQKDQYQIKNFLNNDPLVHRHLDWNSPLDWLSDSAFFIFQRKKELSALLCCAPENQSAAWIRIFAAKREKAYSQVWHDLLNFSIMHLKERFIKKLASLVLYDWFEDLLVVSGFLSHTSIIVLEKKINKSLRINQDHNLIIRPLEEKDIDAVSEIDRIAFEPLWNTNKSALEKALRLAAYSTVAIIDQRVIGYQISTLSLQGAHLARLAISPEHQRQGFAYVLVSKMIDHFYEMGTKQFSVNTQSNNNASLLFYEKMGFKSTGEMIKVFELLL